MTDLVKTLKSRTSGIEYTIRDANTYRSLTDSQAIHLDDNLAEAAGTTADGLYDGNLVLSGEIFTKESGTFQKYISNPLTPSITWDANFTEVSGAYATDGNIIARIYSGNVYKSTDNGLTWTQTATGVSTTEGMYGRFFWYLNNQWIVFTGSTSFKVSSDLVNWESISFTTPGANPSFGYGAGINLAYNGSKYVMIFKNSGNNSKVYYSSNLETWSEPTTPPSVSPLSFFTKSGYIHLTAGNGNFYLIASSSLGAQDTYVFVSTDGGDTWGKYRNSPKTGYNHLYYTDGTLYALAGRTLYYTKDTDSTWSNITLPSDSSASLYSVVYSNEVTCVICSGGLYYSTDLSTWNNDSTGGALGYMFVCNSKFAMVSGYVGTYETQYERSLIPLSLTKTEVMSDINNKANVDEVVEKLSTMPVPEGDDVGRVVMYTGENTAYYEHGYVYECKEGEASYVASIAFSPDKYDHDDGICDLMDFLQMFTPDYLDAASGTIQFNEGNEDEEDWEENEYTFICKDADNNTLFNETFAESEFYDSYGFSPKTSLTDGEVVNFTITIEEDDENYYWDRIDVQPAPAPVVSDTLASLNDVDIQEPEEDNILTYASIDERWVNKPVSKMFMWQDVTLLASDWDGNNEQVVQIIGMKDSSVFWVIPKGGSISEYDSSAIDAIVPNVDELTFLCGNSAPLNDLEVKVIFTKS